MPVWERIQSLLGKSGQKDSPSISPPSKRITGWVTETDIKQIHRDVMSEIPGDRPLDIDRYTEEFQNKTQERDDYESLSREILQEILPEREDHYDFIARYSIMFTDRLEEYIEYLNSEGFEEYRIYQYNTPDSFPPEEQIPEKDVREQQLTSEQRQERTSQDR